MTDHFAKALDKILQPAAQLFVQGMPETLVQLRARLIGVDALLESDDKMHAHRPNVQFALLSIAEMAFQDFMENTNTLIGSR